jgi:hypothetical protein
MNRLQNLTLKIASWVAISSSMRVHKQLIDQEGGFNCFPHLHIIYQTYDNIAVLKCSYVLLHRYPSSRREFSEAVRVAYKRPAWLMRPTLSVPGAHVYIQLHSLFSSDQRLVYSVIGYVVVAARLSPHHGP